MVQAVEQAGPAFAGGTRAITTCVWLWIQFPWPRTRQCETQTEHVR